MENQSAQTLPAFRLLMDSKGESYFEVGKLKTHIKIKSSEFWFSKSVEAWEIDAHTAPRKQFVITLKGKLKFITSDNASFILEPGIILLAEDIEGIGHRWEMMEGYNTWERIYIPYIEASEHYFIKS